MPTPLAFLLPDARRGLSAVCDDATGLFSASGFMQIASPVLRQRRRQGRPSVLVRLQLDDRGHGEPAQQGRRAFAHLLKLAFDGSDLLGHLGQGRFVVLTGWVGEAVQRPLRLLRTMSCGRLDDRLGHAVQVHLLDPLEDDLAMVLAEVEGQARAVH